MSSKKDKKDSDVTVNIQSDALFKKILSKPESAKDFLTYYVPENLLKQLDLSTITVQSESYIEENLKKSFSDIVYEIQTTKTESAFVYVLLEHQSKPDRWMALRLWQYMLRLCERHKTDNKTAPLPLVYPIVFYNGKPKYNSSKNLWGLFTDPDLAKEILTSDYRLIDLQNTSDDEIKQKKHIALLEFFMKHIHMRDSLKLWHRVLTEFQAQIAIDRMKDFEHLKSFLWYTDSKLEKTHEEDLAKLFQEHLSKKDGERVMPTIAEHYMEKGKIEGKIEGIQEGLEESALGMISKNFDSKLISEITKLPMTKIQALKQGMKK